MSKSFASVFAVIQNNDPKFKLPPPKSPLHSVRLFSVSKKSAAVSMTTGCTFSSYDGITRIKGSVISNSRFEMNEPLDRKSTRLNSSHVAISYAVFSYTKKKDKL